VQRLMMELYRAEYFALIDETVQQLSSFFDATNQEFPSIKP